MAKNRAIIFARVSSASQSFERQVHDLQKIAEQKELEVVEVITEKVSGGKGNNERMGVQRLLEVIRAKKADKVLVAEVSRLGRSTMETLRLVEEIHENGVSIHLADLGVDTLNESGSTNLHAEIILHMLSLFSADWRRVHSERVRSGQNSAKASGVRFGRPLGEESRQVFLRKYPDLLNSFKRNENLSLRKRAKLYGVSVNTVLKMSRYLSLDSSM